VYARELTAVEIAAIHAGTAVDSPVVWWKFDDYVLELDSSGNENHGAPGDENLGTPGGPVIVPGKIDNAFSFDGWDDYVDCGKKPGSATALTVAFWMKAVLTQNRIAIDKHPAGSGRGWTVKLRSDGGLWWRIGSNDSFSDLMINSAYEAGVWVHVACTFDNGTAKVYLNGELRGTRINITQAVNDTTTALRMGVPSTVQPTEQFFGLLDDVRVYDVALSETEIITLSLQWKEGALD
jgi:hypothetical protein